MFEYLQGKLESKTPPEIVVDVGGIGYLLNISSRTAESLAPAGSDVRVFVHMHYVENDAPRLFGFTTLLERSVFRHLISVSRVGPAVAISLLSAFDPDEIVLAVVHGEADQLARAKGVGLRTVERMVVELREVFRKLSTTVGMRPRKSQSPVATDLLHVLVGLGFSSRQAQERVDAIVDEHPDGDLETLLRVAMRS